MTTAEAAAIQARYPFPLRRIEEPSFPEPLLVFRGEVFINTAAPSGKPTIYARFLYCTQDTKARRPRNA
jgi:hypothetical protein